MLKIFFYPYFMLIYGASWNVQQCLEGMGVRSSSFIEYDDGGHVISSYLSPAQALLPVVGTLSILTFALCVSIVVAGYVLRRKTGAILAVFLLCLPGMLSLMSLWPVMPLVPDVYVISGRGILGSGWGIAPLLGIGVAAGWSGLLLLSDLLRLGEKFGYILRSCLVPVRYHRGDFFCDRLPGRRTCPQVTGKCAHCATGQYLLVETGGCLRSVVQR